MCIVLQQLTERMYFMKRNYSIEELRKLDQKHFLHPTSPVKTEIEPAFFLQKEKGFRINSKDTL